MAIYQYNISLLSLADCPLIKSPSEVVDLLKAWRKSHTRAAKCAECQQPLRFDHISFTTCCQQFYFDASVQSHPVVSIAVPTPGYVFALKVLKQALKTKHITSDQDYLILPDPIYWQLASTITYEKVMKFVRGLPLTCRSDVVHSIDKVDTFYKDVLNAPLNYGSMHTRSCGKNTFIRRFVLGKRCSLSMRGMIVPDPSLRPNEIQMPQHLVKQFGLLNQWIILNRMPSLQPGNFVGLCVKSPGWEYDCFGIPLEIVHAMNADFDGDECNLYVVPNALSQAECATLLNPECQMGCFVMQGPKLAPTQDMIVVYHLKFDEIDFLPYKHKNLSTTFQVLYDHYGSQQTFEWIDRMRQYYLDVMQNEICFALSLEEMETLFELGRGSLETFKQEASKTNGCLVTQIKSGAQGSFEHLYQMFGQIGYQDDHHITHSFWEGLDSKDAVSHANISTEALKMTCKIWEPGYSYSKMVFNLQGLHVDYRGCLMDGKTVVEEDVLNCLHHTDLMSQEGFKHLLKVTLQ